MGKDVELLKTHLANYIALSREEFNSFVSLLKSYSLKKGEFLIHAGDVCKYESFVTKGCVKSFYEDDNGFEHILDFSIEGWWADDLFSFLTQTPSESSIQAIEDTNLFQISKPDLERVYEKLPKFERFFRLLFQRAYIAQREQINLMLSAPAQERYMQFIKKKPYAENRFPQKDIASYLGITPQFLSVLKKKKIKRVKLD